MGQLAVAVLAIALALSIVRPAMSRPPAAHAVAEHLVRIEASQYQFDPGVVHVKRGERVTIELVATDVVHGLYLDGYGLEMSAEPGQSTRLTFIADRPGAFRFRCSVTCGGMHPFMVGTLRVGNNQLFWGGVGLLLLAAAASIGLSRKGP